MGFKNFFERANKKRMCRKKENPLGAGFSLAAQ
jgi:hypothetical protein